MFYSLGVILEEILTFKNRENSVWLFNEANIVSKKFPYIYGGLKITVSSNFVSL